MVIVREMIAGENIQTTEHRSGVYQDDIYTIALVEKRGKSPTPKKNIGNGVYKMGTNGNDYIDIITVTDHDPEMMHALGNAVDLGPRNCCNCIRCKHIAQGISNKRRFVLIHIQHINPLRSRSRLLKASLLRKISSKITSFRIVKTPRKDGPNFPKLYICSHNSDVELAVTT